MVRGRKSQGVNQPGTRGEQGRGRKSQGANQPGDEQAGEQTSQGANQQRGEKARHLSQNHFAKNK